MTLIRRTFSYPASSRRTCFCCGRLVKAEEDIIRFEQHPDEGVCLRCAAWLHERSQPLP